MPEQPAADPVAETVTDVVKTVEAKLAKGEYGKIFGGIGAIVLAAATWLNNLSNNVSDTKIAVTVQGTKIDAIKQSQDGLDKRFDRMEDRLLAVERKVGDK